MKRPLGTRVYRALLRLFPREIRRERGPEMERLFTDMRAEWGEKEGRSSIGFCGRVTVKRASSGERVTSVSR